MKNLREEYEKETGKQWFANPVSHGEIAFASWDYQKWLEERASHVSDTMRPSPSKEQLGTVTFWLTNILLYLPDDKKIELINQLAERVTDPKRGDGV